MRDGVPDIPARDRRGDAGAQREAGEGKQAVPTRHRHDSGNLLQRTADSHDGGPATSRRESQGEVRREQLATRQVRSDFPPMTIERRGPCAQGPGSS